MRNKKQQSQRKNALLNFLGITIMLFGIGVFLYPLIANTIVSQQSATLVQTFKKESQALSKSQAEQMLKSAEIYNDYIYTRSQKLPYAKDKPDYNKTLSLDAAGMMGYVTIPQIEVQNIPIYHGDSEKTLEMGVGHIEQTSLPIGGKNTHTVLSAHSGRANNTLFTNLDKLEKGDIFYINTVNSKIKYKINDIRIVFPDETSTLSIQKGKDLATLLTCYPTGVNDHRLLVTGERIPNDQKTPEENVQRNKYGYNFWVLIGSIVLTFISIIVITWLSRRSKKNKMKNSQKINEKGGKDD